MAIYDAATVQITSEAGEMGPGRTKRGPSKTQSAHLWQTCCKLVPISSHPFLFGEQRRVKSMLLFRVILDLRSSSISASTLWGVSSPVSITQGVSAHALLK